MILVLSLMKILISVHLSTSSSICVSRWLVTMILRKRVRIRDCVHWFQFWLNWSQEKGFSLNIVRRWTLRRFSTNIVFTQPYEYPSGSRSLYPMCTKLFYGHKYLNTQLANDLSIQFITQLLIVVDITIWIHIWLTIQCFHIYSVDNGEHNDMNILLANNGFVQCIASFSMESGGEKYMNILLVNNWFSPARVLEFLTYHLSNYQCVCLSLVALNFHLLS